MKLKKWLRGKFICSKCGRTFHVMTFGFGTATCPECYEGGQFLDFDESFVLNRLMLRILKRGRACHARAESHGTSIVEARTALPLDGEVKCYGGNRSVPRGETGYRKER